MLPEPTLIRRAQGGDSEAFGALIDRHQRAVAGFLLSLTGDPTAAEDIAQRAFLKAYRRVGAYRETMTFRAWVTRLALKLARSNQRWSKARRWLAGGGRSTDGESAWDGLLDTADRSEIERTALARKFDLERSLASLTRKEREVAILRLEGYSLQEISLVLSLRGGKARSVLYEAAQKLKGRID